MAKNIKIVPQPTGTTLPYIIFENTNGNIISLNVNDDGTLTFSGATHGNNLVVIDEKNDSLEESIN